MELRKYQAAAAEKMLRYPRFVLGNPVGTGKTVISIVAAAEKMSTMPEWRRVCFVIVPAVAKWGWEREIRKWAPNTGVQVVEKKSTPIKPGMTWYVFSYAIFCARIKDLDFVPAMMILDESHCMKNPMAGVTKTILGSHGIARHPAVECAWLTTASPFPNELIDGYTSLAFCAPEKVKGYWSFANRYCYVRKTPWGKKVHSSKNVDELRKLVGEYVHRDELEEVLPELPDFSESIVTLDPTPEVARINRETESIKESIKEVIENGERPGEEVGKLSSFRKLLAIEKIAPTVEFVQNILDQGESVVVFAHHKEAISGIAEKLGGQFITGDTSSKVRQQRIDDFQDGKTKCLVLSIKAAGINLTLTKAHIVVFAETLWSPADLEQPMGRIRRIGQEHFCFYYFLQFKGSIDEVAYRASKSKARSIDKFWKEGSGDIDWEERNEIIEWD